MGKLYFASDIHLGVPDLQSSLVREKKLVRWLESIAHDADEIFIVGDLFDFWFEYKDVVPKGFTRLLGCFAGLADRGIKLHFFKGNHDMWMFGYFEQEFGASVHSNEYIFERGGKKFFVHHGDGLGKGDQTYKWMKRFFRSYICQRAFAFLHPRIGIGIARFFSSRSRLAQLKYESKDIDLEKEWLVNYCREVVKNSAYDYMVFGHRHLPLDIPLGKGARYINLGEWFTSFSYASFDGTELALMYFDEKD